MELEVADSKKIVVLGAGITGLTVAWQLSKVYKNKVVVIEKEPYVGGLAATVSRKIGPYEVSLDLGSHRLHESPEPGIFELIQELCGGLLLKRKREGLIFLKDTYLKYPPSAFDILFGFGAQDGMVFLRDFFIARLSLALKGNDYANFEAFVKRQVGTGLYERFYKPYALKLWGIPPSHISYEPAVSRMRKFTFGMLWNELEKRILGMEENHYFYPAQGIGAISNAMMQQLRYNGAEIYLSSRIDEIKLKGNREVEDVTFLNPEGKKITLKTAFLISTIPVNTLHHLIRFESEHGKMPPFDLRWRDLRILHLALNETITHHHETFYFPEPDMFIGRVSEVSKYSPSLNPECGHPVLTVEIPCSEGDWLWNINDDALSSLCVSELKKIKVLRKEITKALHCFSVKETCVYPVYELGWKEKYEAIYDRLNTVRNLYLVGRSGLFLHCNIDHCMAMGLKLAEFILSAKHDKKEWESAVKGFFKFRVRE